MDCKKENILLLLHLKSIKKEVYLQVYIFFQIDYKILNQILE